MKRWIAVLLVLVLCAGFVHALEDWEFFAAGDLNVPCRADGPPFEQVSRQVNVMNFPFSSIYWLDGKAVQDSKIVTFDTQWVSFSLDCPSRLYPGFGLVCRILWDGESVGYGPGIYGLTAQGTSTGADADVLLQGLSSHQCDIVIPPFMIDWAGDEYTLVLVGAIIKYVGEKQNLQMVFFPPDGISMSLMSDYGGIFRKEKYMDTSLSVDAKDHRAVVPLDQFFFDTYKQADIVSGPCSYDKQSRSLIVDDAGEEADVVCVVRLSGLALLPGAQVIDRKHVDEIKAAGKNYIPWNEIEHATVMMDPDSVSDVEEVRVRFRPENLRSVIGSPSGVEMESGGHASLDLNEFCYYQDGSFGDRYAAFAKDIVLIDMSSFPGRVSLEGGVLSVSAEAVPSSVSRVITMSCFGSPLRVPVSIKVEGLGSVEDADVPVIADVQGPIASQVLDPSVNKDRFAAVDLLDKVNEVRRRQGADLLDVEQTIDDAERNKFTYLFEQSYDSRTHAVTMRISPFRPISIDIYQRIDKSTAQSVDDISFTDLPEGVSVEIVDPDPLIVWHFDRVDAPMAVTYQVPEGVEEPVTATFVAAKIEGKTYVSLDLLLGILVVFVVVVGVIFFERKPKHTR
ncbi:MAG: hypothetical protein ABIH41_05975 [Nanoarchaeota archaeon]